LQTPCPFRMPQKVSSRNLFGNGVGGGQAGNKQQAGDPATDRTRCFVWAAAAAGLIVRESSQILKCDGGI
jgi:hypothetical protein